MITCFVCCGYIVYNGSVVLHRLGVRVRLRSYTSSPLERSGIVPHEAGRLKRPAFVLHLRRRQQRCKFTGNLATMRI